MACLACPCHDDHTCLTHAWGPQDTDCPCARAAAAALAAVDASPIEPEYGPVPAN
jgi:hypothetical protein